MSIELIVVPYDSGQRGFRMGRGPEHLLESGLVAQLESAGIATATTVIEADPNEAASAFDLAPRIAAATAAACARRALPVILGGNCLSSLGGFAGVGSSAAVLWLDAHADFNTPETSPSGFIDGMALSIMTGRCFAEQSAAVPGFRPLRTSELIMLGVREVDAGERGPLAEVKIARSARELWVALAQLESAELYLHVDLDALDPSVLAANQFASPRGLSVHSLHDAVAAARANKRIVALAITAYDPTADVIDSGPAIVRDLIRSVGGVEV